MEDAAAGAGAAAGSSWHEQLTPANADGSTHTGAPSCAETDMDDSSMPTPADAPVSMRMHNRSHRNVERRAARRAALHAGQAGHCPYITHLDTQCDTTDSQELQLAHSPDTGDEPAALHR